MQKIVQGVHNFRSGVFASQQALFERLAGGQSPDALFITCSDSRINPNLITQTEPGELFILRNAGNIVPPHGAGNNGEGATIEFAVAGLKVRDIIVCGHTACGAVKALLNPSSLDSLPLMREWLCYAHTTKTIMDNVYKTEKDEAKRINIAIQENVLAQLENLRTHPVVAAGLIAGTLNLHGWVYKFETGDIFSYDPSEGQFVPLKEATAAVGGMRGKLEVATI
jgi:carbonic anhydrase